MSDARPSDPEVPVVERFFAHGDEREPFAHWDEWDRLRDEHPWFWSTYAQGFWVMVDGEACREAYKRPDVFSSSSNFPNIPDPPFRLVPSHSDPPEHLQYRQILNHWFSPGQAEALVPSMRDNAERIVRSFSDRGACDFMADFAEEFPATIFMLSMGLPPEDATQLHEWVTVIMGSNIGGDDLANLDLMSPRAQSMITAMLGIRTYFQDAIAERRASPRDPEADFLTYYLNATMDGRPVTEEEVLDTCQVLALGGLDTVHSQLGWTFRHLATHPEDRRRLIEQPDLIPYAVEEIFRAYPIVGMAGRKLTQDIEFHGCPMKKGQMVMLLSGAEQRDPARYADPTEVDFDRTGIRHLSFGGGAHRCLGMHLSRREIGVAIEEWHRLIPDYRIAPGTELREDKSPIALQELPLIW